MERLTQRLRTGEVLMASNCEEKYTEQEWICVLQDRLAAYEDSGCDPEEVLPKDKSDEIALKLMRLADLENLCSYTRLRELAEADKGDRVVAAMSDKQAAAALREYLENREMPATVYVAICVAIRKLEEPMDGGADDE